LATREWRIKRFFRWGEEKPGKRPAFYLGESEDLLRKGHWKREGSRGCVSSHTLTKLNFTTEKTKKRQKIGDSGKEGEVL